MTKNYPSKVICLKAKLLLLMAFLSLSVHAADLAPYALEYQAHAQGFTLKTVRKLEKKPGFYELSQITSTMMMQTSENSIFGIDDQGSFLTRSFTYQRKILGNNMLRQTAYYPKKRTAIYTEEGETPVHVAIPQNIYDVLSYQEKMRLDLIASQGRLKSNLFNVLEKQRVRQYDFKYSGSEWLSTKLGYLATIKIERVRDNNTKQTTVWLAKDWGYVIVKVLHKDVGEPDYQLNITKGTFNHKAIKGSKKAQPATM